MRIVPDLIPEDVLQCFPHDLLAVAPQCEQGFLLWTDPRPAAGAELADGPRSRPVGSVGSKLLVRAG
jgi:hypothetical protein